MAKHTKESTLNHWKELTPADPLKYMEPIPYKATGSRYGACGIRIDGNPQFIDAVLSLLKPLIDGENHVTRLELARSEVKQNTVNGKVKSFDNRADNAECCYIRLHMRGNEGAMASMVFDRHLRGATERFANL